MLEMILIFPLLIVLAIVFGIGLAYIIHKAVSDDDDWPTGAPA